ncbi:MAG: DNA replication/repair protein RecF [Erysipelotrichaceae bacterium]|nr:DNA replication/repair protein RecF [Erysipelotrichaceae bacterium]
MRINKLELTNFRNFESFELSFNHDINIFLGKNAQGKTNLIEAIYLLSVCRSFRTHILEQLICFDQKFTKVSANVLSNNKTLDLEVVIAGKNKKAKIDHNDIHKTSEYVGYLNAVVFTPDDLNLIKGGPSLRRKFIDLELSKVSPIYVFNLSKYNRLLKEKNKYLKILNAKKVKSDIYLEVLNEQMALLQVDIIKKRVDFISKLSFKASKIYDCIAQNKEKLSLNYQSFINYQSETLASDILESLNSNSEKDIKYTLTQIGIHKDDIIVLLNDKNAINFASQGQQRTIVLAMKIALLELIKEEIGEYPILLLDDVLSELDGSRKAMLLNLLNQKIQTFITTTSVEDIDEKIIDIACIYKIENGHLKED